MVTFKISNQRTLALLAALITALVLSSCGGPPAYSASNSLLAEKAADVAASMVGTRYRYGGNKPGKGFDCSGLVQYSFLRAGRKVPRSTQMQRRRSRTVSLKHIKKGDLIFFNQSSKRSSHVGIYLGNRRFVHAPSSGKNVRIDKITPYWARHLASARRFR
jgi:cell wall-associated NlpC family hydrolase